MERPRSVVLMAPVDLARQFEAEDLSDGVSGADGAVVLIDDVEKGDDSSRTVGLKPTDDLA